MHVAMHMISRLRPLVDRCSHCGGGVDGTQCTVSRCSKLDANLCFVANDPIKVDDVVARDLGKNRRQRKCRWPEISESETYQSMEILNETFSHVKSMVERRKESNGWVRQKWE